MAAPPLNDSSVDADSRLVNMSCFDLLLIELVPLAERMARAYEASLDRPTPSPTSSTATKRTSKGPPPMGANNAISTSTTAKTTTNTTTTTTPSSNSAPSITVTGANTTAASSQPSHTALLAADGLPTTTIFADSVYVRLERLGFRVGEGLSERISRDRPRFNPAGINGSNVGNVNDHHLDVIKFLCKDIWGVVWRKQVDNLKTNHRGVFVLTDNKFRPLTRMSMANHAEAMQRARPHLFFPCGIIRGVLSSLGIKATVQAETMELPSAIFQITTVLPQVKP
ncbi:uncharacterized protein Z519_02371 [Cladophialophora bantiana CBS 173.52]|uniref:Trafficking protein particle complex subunit 6B n=1 Tax=Cladophialophora bantiana (strain ATCC 10958 / CBS 173.52 / CDC B-1940 / NIH 8579) TaxID=1442370 RepID=A0A0D2I1E0_CLAB1|nr:uncharacterized protein Z519_02371 [Cladophialophora bantiana CBS 173.52]KIW96980.1 hypothetical protein Z519_02371 [Cladophialophora bantiana CBS 173.52]